MKPSFPKFRPGDRVVIHDPNAPDIYGVVVLPPADDWVFVKYDQEPHPGVRDGWHPVGEVGPLTPRAADG